jgi:hypothetical protein
MSLLMLSEELAANLKLDDGEREAVLRHCGGDLRGTALSTQRKALINALAFRTQELESQARQQFLRCLSAAEANGSRWRLSVVHNATGYIGDVDQVADVVGVPQIVVETTTRPRFLARRLIMKITSDRRIRFFVPSRRGPVEKSAEVLVDSHPTAARAVMLFTHLSADLVELQNRERLARIAQIRALIHLR